MVRLEKIFESKAVQN